MANVKSIKTLSRADMVKACNDLFGEQPEDVIAPLNCASEALTWMQAICVAISKEATGDGDQEQIKKLAEVGAYVATEMGEYAGCQFENMMQQLRDRKIAN